MTESVMLKCSKSIWSNLLGIEQENTGTFVFFIKYSQKGLNVCFYISARFSSVVVYDITSEYNSATLYILMFTFKTRFNCLINA